VIRRGLDAAEPPKKREPFRTVSYDPGKPFVPLNSVGDILEMLDEEDFKAKRSE
jgi:hypothetical protein